MCDSSVRAFLASASVPIRRAWLSDHIKIVQHPRFECPRHRGILSFSNPGAFSKQTPDADAVQSLAICRVLLTFWNEGDLRSVCSMRPKPECTRLQELANEGDYQIASPTFGTMLQGSNIILHQTAVERSDTGRTDLRLDRIIGTM